MAAVMQLGGGVSSVGSGSRNASSSSPLAASCTAAMATSALSQSRLAGNASQGASFVRDKAPPLLAARSTSTRENRVHSAVASAPKPTLGAAVSVGISLLGSWSFPVSFITASFFTRSSSATRLVRAFRRACVPLTAPIASA